MVAATMPVLTGPDATAGAHVLAERGFAALWHGRQPRVVDLGVDTAVIDAQVRAGRLEIDESGRLVGVHGLVARPTAHRIEHANGVVHTWCALDAIGIPAALGLAAIAITTCPACSNELRVTLDQGEPNGRSRLPLVAARADRARIWSMTSAAIPICSATLSTSQPWCRPTRPAGW